MIIVDNTNIQDTHCTPYVTGASGYRKIVVSFHCEERQAQLVVSRSQQVMGRYHAPHYWYYLESMDVDIYRVALPIPGALVQPE
jgi:hypothetical protein